MGAYRESRFLVVGKSHEDFERSTNMSKNRQNHHHTSFSVKVTVNNGGGKRNQGGDVLKALDKLFESEYYDYEARTRITRRAITSGNANNGRVAANLRSLSKHLKSHYADHDDRARMACDIVSQRRR